MAGVFFVYEGVVARRCHRHRTRPCVFVCCAFYCCCCCCCAGVYCVASVDVQSLVQFLSRFRIVTASFTAVGIPRWPEPKSPSSHFPPAPTSSGRVIFVVFYARLVRSTRLMKSNKMHENVAKNGWELTKVARIGRSRWLYGQKPVSYTHLTLPTKA